jgi:hypothetical protein
MKKSGPTNAGPVKLRFSLSKRHPFFGRAQKRRKSRNFISSRLEPRVAACFTGDSQDSNNNSSRLENWIRGEYRLELGVIGLVRMARLEAR